MRHFSTNKQEAKDALDVLIKNDVKVEEYRNAFHCLGQTLGDNLKKIISRGERILIACASEDADWLAKGVMEKLPVDVGLAVFWTDRIKVCDNPMIEISPIIKSYIDINGEYDTVVIVKSIISTSCVVKSQLNNLLGKVRPNKIYVLAPVMYKDAEANLRKEFPPTISEKFVFMPLAIDDERDESGVVKPGVGGWVYPKLGLGDVHSKNEYMPGIVAERMVEVNMVCEDRHNT